MRVDVTRHKHAGQEKMSGGSKVVVYMSDWRVHGKGADMERTGCLPGEMGVTEPKVGGNEMQGRILG